jgi:hypothetical protein
VEDRQEAAGNPLVLAYCSPYAERTTVRRVARTPKKPVNFRADGTDWEDAIATADGAGEHLPDELRNFLAWYARKPGARTPRRPDRAVRASDSAAS